MKLWQVIIWPFNVNSVTDKVYRFFHNIFYKASDLVYYKQITDVSDIPFVIVLM
jgi:hypothetical protein